MRRWFQILFVATLVFVPAACSSSGPDAKKVDAEPVVPDGWHPYKDKASGVSFALPGPAQKNAAKNAVVPWKTGLSVGVRSWTTNSATDGSITTSVFDYPQGTLGQALDMITAPLSQVPDAKLTKKTGVYHGRPYLDAVATYTTAPGSTTRSMVRLMWVANGHMVRVMLSGDIDHKSANDKTFNGAVNSIGFPKVHVSAPPKVAPTTTLPGSPKPLVPGGSVPGLSVPNVGVTPSSVPAGK